MIKVVNTDVFFGSSYSGNNEGGIGVDGKGNSAGITFRDKNGNKTLANIKVYNKLKLMTMNVYRKSVEDAQSEKLVHEWHTCRLNKNTIIKYAGNSELAFVFEMNDENLNADIYLDSLSTELSYLDYFRELKFVRTLRDKFNASIDDVKNIKPMNDERIKILMKDCKNLSLLAGTSLSLNNICSLGDNSFRLLLNDPEGTIDLYNKGFKFSLLDKLDSKKLEWIKKNPKDFLFLLNNGITPAEIISIDQTMLDKFLQKLYWHKEAFQFITVRQALGVDHTPLPLNKIKIRPQENQYQSLGSDGGGSSGPYSYEHNGDEIKVTYEESKKFEVTFGEIKSAFETQLAEQINKGSQISLVHTWYAFNNNTVYYCPDLHQVMFETARDGFPTEEFKAGPGTYMLLDAPFYQEKDFVKNLAEKGWPIDKLRATAGMTQQKIEMFFNHKHNFFSLIEKGLQFSDLKKIDEARFSIILTHFDKAKNALEFVSISELLGLNENVQPEQLPSLINVGDQMLFSQSNQSNNSDVLDEKQENTNSCQIM